MNLSKGPNGIAIAGTTILMTLFDHLLADGILRPTDVRNILTKAVNDMAGQTGTVGVTDAMDLIRSDMLPRFRDALKKD